MIIALSLVLIGGVLALVLFVRPGDVPQEAPPSPVQHLEDRKAAIYENLRDLNFEFRLGKLSDADYQKTKTGLQAELAKVMAEMDRILKNEPLPAAAAPAVATNPLACPHCGAKFEKPMKFCGECGKGMEAGA
jgi:hypothetical protein